MKINEKQLINIVEEATRKALKEISYTTIDNSLTKSATLVNYYPKRIHCLEHAHVNCLYFFHFFTYHCHYWSIDIAKVCIKPKQNNKFFELSRPTIRHYTYSPFSLYALYA